MAFDILRKSPWDSGQSSPNIEDFLKSLQNRLKGFRLWNGWLIAGVIVAIWAFTGIYTVESGELGVVRRFGKMISIAQPGIQYRIPWPVDQVDVVKVEQLRSMELGFRSGPQGSTQFRRGVLTESQMITGDTNLVNIEVVVQYRISDLPAYLFNVWDPQGTPDGRTLRDAAETALRGVVGSMVIDDILTVGRARVQDETKIHLQQLMDQYETGLLITTVKLQAVEPPQQVQAAFKDVVSAKEDRERIINEAMAYAEDLLPKARGEAQQMLRAAEAYKETRVKGAEGDSARFLSMLKEYRLAKSVTRQRLYLETMAEVLSKVNKVVISSEVGGKTLPLLPLTGIGGVAPARAREQGAQ